VELKEATVAFERDRAKIEHHLVPFIAPELTYTTPTVLEDDIKGFAGADCKPDCRYHLSLSVLNYRLVNRCAERRSIW